MVEAVLLLLQLLRVAVGVAELNQQGHEAAALVAVRAARFEVLDRLLQSVDASVVRRVLGLGGDLDGVFI